MKFRWLALAFVIVLGILLLAGLPYWPAFLILFGTGRHFAYVGETVSFRDRHGEHISGGGRWKKRCASWSDLDPVCVLRIPAPKWKPLLRTVETLVIFLCQPVYNEKKNLWNLRRITRASAKRMRMRRNRRRVKLNILNLRSAHLIVILIIIIGVFS